MHYGQAEGMHAADLIASRVWTHERDLPTGETPAVEPEESALIVADSAGADGVNDPSESDQSDTEPPVESEGLRPLRRTVGESGAKS